MLVFMSLFFARAVLEGILAGTYHVNFKGIMVGNGVSNAPGADGLQVYVPFLYGHGVISTKLYNEIQVACKNPGSTCDGKKAEAYDLASGLNVYGIYYDCYSQRPTPSSSVGSDVPCVDSQHADKYLNMAATKQAIHVNSTITWSICSDAINERYDRTSESMVPIHKFLLSHGIRVLIYSGDTDFAVPYLDSQFWTSTAGLTETRAWHQWAYTDTSGRQVAGSATEYKEGLTFVTVRGAGHMVPQYAPQQAFEMLTRFLNNRPF